MPWEIHSSTPLYVPPEDPKKHDKNVDIFTSTTTSTPTVRNKAPGACHVKFRFQHDLESLWWVALWILICRVGGDTALELGKQIFTSSDIPSKDRTGFFRSADDDLTEIIHRGLRETVPAVLDIRGFIRNSYLDPAKFETLENFEPYHDIYDDVWAAFVSLIREIREVKGVDFQDPPPSPPPTGEVAKKRSRSPSKSMGAAKKQRSRSKPNDDKDYMPTLCRKKRIPRKHLEK